MEFKADVRIRFKDREEMYLLEVASNIMYQLMNGIVNRSNSKIGENSFRGFQANAELCADVVQADVGEDALGWCKTVLSNLRKRGAISGFDLEFGEAPSNKIIVANLRLGGVIEIPVGDRHVELSFKFLLDMENGFVEFGLQETNPVVPD